MHPGRAGRSLGERAANSGVGTEATLPARLAAPPERAPGSTGDPLERREGRHCWVHDPPDAAGTWPGLLVEWRQREGAWEGRVVYTVPGAGGSVLVESWVPARRLEPR